MENQRNHAINNESGAGLDSAVSDCYRPSYILESESWGSMKKLVPDNHGEWILFKCRGGSWEWDDSICDDSCVRLMEQAEKVYMSR